MSTNYGYNRIFTYQNKVVWRMFTRFNFNKVAQYKQLTLEEAEEKISNRKKTADGYERWMMKAANNGAALFGEVERLDKDNGGAGGKGRRKTAGGDDDEEGNGSDRGDEDEDEELERKKRLNKRGGDGGDGDDDNEGVGGGDVDMDDDDIEKGKHLSFFYFAL